MAKKNNPIEPLRNKDNSLRWYKEQIKKLGLTNHSSAMNAGIGTYATGIEVGKMYLYSYDAKHKDTLPYWDMFPLVFPFSPTKDGFIGINLHYLPYLLRLKLLEELSIYATKQRPMTKQTRLKLSWNVLSKVGMAHPCVKRYLSTHIRSHFLEIHPQDWKTAALLPVEHFVGKDKTAVFKLSKGMIF